MIIYLLGYKSSGKTTLGKLLAEKLNMSFVDLDEYIENLKRKNEHIYQQAHITFEPENETFNELTIKLEKLKN